VVSLGRWHSESTRSRLPAGLTWRRQASKNHGQVGQPQAAVLRTEVPRHQRSSR
jgi:hypothetical protein